MTGVQTCALPICESRHGPAINLKIETEIPSEVRHSIYSEVARRDVTRPEISRWGTSFRNGADENCTHKSKNRKNDAGEVVSWFHDTHCTQELDFRQQTTTESVTNLSEHSENYRVAMSAYTRVERQNLRSARGKICVLSAPEQERRICAHG